MKTSIILRFYAKAIIVWMGLSLVVASLYTDLLFIKILAWVIFGVSILLAFIANNDVNVFKSTKKRNKNAFISVILIFSITIIFISFLSPGLNSYATESIKSVLYFMGVGVLLFTTAAWIQTVMVSE